jgi:hypothetical protein
MHIAVGTYKCKESTFLLKFCKNSGSLKKSTVELEKVPRMRPFLFFLLMLPGGLLPAQQLQFHYDFRHSVDPELNPRNFTSLNFEYFSDSVATGSFLLKVQADLNGEKGNTNQVFMQVTKDLRFWKPDFYLSLGYSGGLGITETTLGYYIVNSYSIGVAYPFQWSGFYCNAASGYRYNSFPSGSHDVHLTIYFWKGLLNYRLSVSGSFVGWTQNRNTGTDMTKHLSGKKIAFYADPQIWAKVWKRLSAGTRILFLYHVVSDANALKIYPTLGIKYDFSDMY